MKRPDPWTVELFTALLVIVNAAIGIANHDAYWIASACLLMLFMLAAR